MEEQKKKKENLFRLVIFSENTFEEVRSFQFRMWYLWVAIGIIVLILGVITASILSIKPIKAYMNQEYSFIDSDDLIVLRQKIIDLEKTATAQQLYINNLRMLLSGEVVESPDSAIQPTTSDSTSEVHRVEEDEALRRLVSMEDQLQSVARTSTSTVSNVRSLEQLYLVPPLTGSVSMEFDLRKDHLGVDINAPADTPVKTVMDGHIIYAGWTLETGNTIGIQHDNNLISFYKHNSALLKNTGSFVQAGEAVAIIGNTGTLSTGPHLHFELWSNGNPVDPTNYINFE